MTEWLSRFMVHVRVGICREGMSWWLCQMLQTQNSCLENRLRYRTSVRQLSQPGLGIHCTTCGNVADPPSLSLSKPNPQNGCTPCTVSPPSFNGNFDWQKYWQMITELLSHYSLPAKTKLHLSLFTTSQFHFPQILLNSYICCPQGYICDLDPLTNPPLDPIWLPGLLYTVHVLG